MKLGANLISPHQVPTILKLFERGEINYCEIMLDNFIHFDPLHIKKVFADKPLAIHIVASRFVEICKKKREALALHVQKWLRVIQPIYVSDHLLRFSRDGKRLALVEEYDYVQHAEMLIEAIQHWQSLFDYPLYFENHASTTLNGARQPEFFSKMMHTTGARLLFDISNAVIAEKNRVAAISDWQEAIAKTTFFHIGGFKVEPQTGLYIDTHDCSLDVAARKCLYALADQQAVSCIVEFQANIAPQIYMNEIQNLHMDRYVAC